MRIKLTTNHAPSSYGVPVALIDGQACGPVDGMYGQSAARHVADWATQPERTAEEIDAAGKFLSQWPDGPQLDPRQHEIGR